MVSPHLIVIGSSTGGTLVLTDLLHRLPRLSACMVIVQHMPKYINESFVRTLSRDCRMTVRLAADGDLLEPGLALVAPSETHCTFLNNRSLRLAPGPAVNYVCPSIDVAMQSLAAPAADQQILGILLTGMGRDGAEGLVHLKRLGGLTIAQNKETCTVYGMPAEAVKRGGADCELAPEEITRLLITKFAGAAAGV